MIRNLLVRSFRGVSVERPFEFGHITLLSGRNGLGKTTVFDAIDWCLFGASSRLGSDSQVIRNLYRSSEDPYVALTLDGPTDERVVARTLGGATIDGAPVSDRELVDSLVIDRSVFPPYFQDVAGRLRTLLYLQQTDIRLLVSTSEEETRIALFQGLLGVPNAELVRSGIRRVSDRLRARQRTLSSELADVQNEIVQAEESLGAEPSQREEVLAERVRYALVSLFPLLDANEELDDQVIMMCRAELARAAERREALQRTASRITALQVSRDRVMRQLDAENLAVRTAEGDVRERERIYDAAKANSDGAQAALLLARHERGVAATVLEGAQRDLSRVAAVGGAREAVASAEVAVESMSGEYERTADRATEANRAARDAEARLRTVREAARVAAQQRRLHEEYQTEIARRASVVARLDELGRRMAAGAEVLGRLRRELDGALRAQKRQQDAYDAVAASAERAQRLQGVITEAARLLRESDRPDCPLCGAFYTTADNLRRQVAETVDGLATAARSLAELRKAVDDAASAKKRLQDRVDQEAERLRSQESDQQAMLGELSSAELRLEDLIRQGAQNVVPDVAETAQAEELAEAARQAQADAAEALEEVTAAFQVAKEDLAVERSRLDGLVQGVAASLLSQNVFVLSQAVNQADERATSAGKLVASREREFERASMAKQTAEESLDASRSGLAAAHAEVGRLSRENDRLQAEMRRAMESIEGQGADPNGIDNAVDAAQEREDAIARVLDDLEALQSLRRRTLTSLHLAELRRTESRTMDEIDLVSSAAARFQAVSEAVLNRAVAEETMALDHQRAAIQECFRALLPHRHLDEIEIDSQTGSIFVTDRYLRSQRHGRVGGDIFLSTGQANALALAIFLGIGLRQRVTDLGFLLLDEPVQNLDDVHFLAFMTLVKRAALRRQVILSTADGNFGELFRRQMKSSWTRAELTFIEHEWQSFSPEEGPTVTRRA